LSRFPERGNLLKLQRYAGLFGLSLVIDVSAPFEVPGQGLMIGPDFSLSKNQAKLKNLFCVLCVLKRLQGAGERIL